MPNPADYNRKLTREEKREIRKMRRALRGHSELGPVATLLVQALAIISFAAFLALAIMGAVWAIAWLWSNIPGT